MLIGADTLLGILGSYRLCWIAGKPGGHKTSLAFRLAKEFLEKGYRLVTNSRCIWADDFEQVQLTDTNHLKCVVVLDEGGQFFKSGRQVEMIASYPAKMDTIYIIPSFWPPTRAAQVLVVQPLFNFKSAGLPVVYYQWRVKIGGFEDKGSFIWVFPQEIYGIYSRQDPGDTATEVIDFLVRRTEEFRGRYGRADKPVLEVEEGDSLLEAAGVMEEAAYTISSLSQGKRGRRRI